MCLFASTCAFVSLAASCVFTSPSRRLYQFLFILMSYLIEGKQVDRAQKLRGERLQKQEEKEKRSVEVAVYYHAGFPPISVSLSLRHCLSAFVCYVSLFGSALD